MKTLVRSLTLLASAPAAYAAQKAQPQDFGLLGVLFLAFVALIVLNQLVPSVALFASMLHGLFSSAPRAARRAHTSEKTV